MMRLLLVIFTVAISACSSEDSAGTQAGDAGADVRVACGTPWTDVTCLCADGQMGQGVCRPNGSIEPCACPPPLVDAGGDDAPVADTGVPVDMGTGDAREDLERALCSGGAPRLSWKSDGCHDTGVAGVSDYICRFRTAGDAKVRCMPAQTSTIGGYAETTCDESRALLTWSTTPVPKLLLVDGSGVKTGENVRPGAGAWSSRSGGTCMVATMVYPHDAGGMVVTLAERLPHSAFYAASF